MIRRNYAFLLENPDVRHWYKNGSIDSCATADVYLQKFIRYIRSTFKVVRSWLIYNHRKVKIEIKDEPNPPTLCSERFAIKDELRLIFLLKGKKAGILKTAAKPIIKPQKRR